MADGAVKQTHKKEKASEQAAHRRGAVRAARGGESSDPPAAREARVRTGNSLCRHGAVKVGVWPRPSAHRVMGRWEPPTAAAGADPECASLEGLGRAGPPAVRLPASSPPGSAQRPLGVGPSGVQHSAAGLANQQMDPHRRPTTKGWVCTRQRGGSSELSEGPLLPISTATIKETGDDQRWAGCGDTGRVCPVGRMRDGAAAGGSRVGRRFLEALSVALPWGPAAPPLALGPGHLNAGAQRDGATVTCRAA